MPESPKSSRNGNLPVRQRATANPLSPADKAAKEPGGELLINSRPKTTSKASAKDASGATGSSRSKKADKAPIPLPTFGDETKKAPIAVKQRATGSAGSGNTTPRRKPDPTRTPARAKGGNFQETDRVTDIAPEVQQEITGIVLLLISLILFFGLISQEGLVASAGQGLKRLFGLGAFVIPPLVAVIGGTLIWEGITNRERFRQSRLLGVIMTALAFISLLHLLTGNSRALAERGEGGGFVAYYTNEVLRGIITPYGVGFLWLTLMVVGLMLAMSMSLSDMWFQVRNGFRFLRGAPPLVAGEPMEDYDLDDWDGYSVLPSNSRRTALNEDDLLDELLLNGLNRKGKRPPMPPDPEPAFTHTIDLKAPDAPEAVSQALPVPETSAPLPRSAPVVAKNVVVEKVPLASNWRRDDLESPELSKHLEWQLPATSMLASFSDVEVNPAELRKKARLIENCLSSFGVEAYVREVNTGPTVTQYALEPGIGVKVSRITGLANDMALALAAPSIRIEAPVPGQSRVGIEVPNSKIATVGLRELMEVDEFTKKVSRLKFALGRDVSGQPIVVDLAKMPHLLIAGSTGSGKSVCLNSIVAAYLLQYRPNELQFIMIDPKMVELSTYNGIPHLRFPVVTQIESDPEQEKRQSERVPTVMSVLKWTIREMEKRYKTLSVYGHRNIESYNKAAVPGSGLERLSYLVLIIDELADLMMVAPEEAESAICRLAQKARAVGIHLILATQRPSVDVVTGLIKANFPSRITFAVTSQIDSRVILDMAGAEKLLGRGDMLYLGTDAAKPMRVQGVYVSDEEIDAIVKHWRIQTEFLNGKKESFVQPALWPKDLQEIEAERNTDESDELFEQALEIVRDTRTASTSLLQRRLRIGYNRAARLIDELAQAGIIGHSENGKGRSVLLDEDKFGEVHSLTQAANAFEPEDMPPPSVPKPAVSFAAPDYDAPIRPRQSRPAPVDDEYDPDPPL